MECYHSSSSHYDSVYDACFASYQLASINDPTLAILQCRHSLTIRLDCASFKAFPTIDAVAGARSCCISVSVATRSHETSFFVLEIVY